LYLPAIGIQSSGVGSGNQALKSVSTTLGLFLFLTTKVGSDNVW